MQVTDSAMPLSGCTGWKDRIGCHGIALPRMAYGYQDVLPLWRTDCRRREVDPDGVTHTLSIK